MPQDWMNHAHSFYPLLRTRSLAHWMEWPPSAVDASHEPLPPSMHGVTREVPVENYAERNSIDVCIEAKHED